MPYRARLPAPDVDRSRERPLARPLGPALAAVIVAAAVLAALALVPGTAAASQGTTYDPGQNTPGEYTVWVVDGTTDEVEHVYNFTADGAHLNVTRDGSDLGIDVVDRDNTSALITYASTSATAEDDVLAVGPGTYNVSANAGTGWTGPALVTADPGANVTRVVGDGTVLAAAASGPSTLLAVDDPDADDLAVENVSFEANGVATSTLHVGATAPDATIALSNVSVNDTTGPGLWTDDSLGSLTVSESTVTNSGGDGLSVAPAADLNLSVSNSTFADNDGRGVIADDVNHSEVVDSTVERNGLDGVRLVATNTSTVANTTVRDNGGHGVVLETSDDNTVRDNTVTDNTGFGLRLFGADDNQLAANAVTGNDQSGGGWQVTIDGTSTGTAVTDLDLGASTAAHTTVDFEARAVLVRGTGAPSDLPDPLTGSLTSTGRYVDAVVNPGGYLDVALHYEDADAGDESALALWENPFLDQWRKAFGATVDAGANTVSYNVTGGAQGAAPTLGVFEDDTGTLTGTVADQSGTGLDGQVFVQDSGGQFRTFESDLPGGDYRFAVPPGTYSLFADADGNTTEAREGVAVGAAETVTVDVTLPAAAYLEGYVDASGGGLSGQEAVVVNHDGQFYVNGTAAGGAYRLEVPAGTHNVVGFDPSTPQGRIGQNSSVTVDSGETVTDVNVTLAAAQVTNTDLTVLEGSGTEDVGDLEIKTQFAPPVFLGVAIDNTSRAGEPGEPALPDDLASANVTDSTVLQLELTVDGIQPDALLWGAKDVEWDTEPNAAGPGTNITINTSPVHLAGVEAANVSGTSAVAGPVPPDQDISQIEWPTGANDTAPSHLDWNSTVYVMLMDTVLMPSDLQDQFGNVTVTTNAQLFSTPELDAENDRLRVYAAGPGERADGTNHTGFYRAFVPDRVLEDWGVADPEAELTALVRGEGAENVDVTETADGPRGASGAWVNITDLHYSDGYIDVQPSQGGGQQDTSDDDDDGSSSGAVTTTATATPTPTEAPTGTATPAATESPAEESTDAGTETPTATATPTPTAEPAPTDTPAATETPGQPGFGLALAVLALLAVAGLGRRRA